MEESAIARQKGPVCRRALAAEGVRRLAEAYRVGIIGCGGRGRAHWRGYQASGRCHLVAVADVNRAGAEAFVARVAEAEGPVAVYEDAARMLAEVKPDIVSVCTWPDTHAPLVLAALTEGARAIFAEKPMAPTWGEAVRMGDAARRAGVPLLFCHQRRFESQFVTARRLLREGAIGPLTRVEATCDNLFDWGTHWFDMLHFFNEETPARWVLGQIDVRAGRRVFGALVEDQGLALVQFANGVQGLLITGADRQSREMIRLVGTDGVMEIQAVGPDGMVIPLRVRGRGDGGFHPVDVAGGVAPAEAGAVADLLRCLESGDEPELSVEKALRATALIFATYESSRRRGRVDLPLTIEDSPLAAMVAAGVFGGGQ